MEKSQYRLSMMVLSVQIHKIFDFRLKTWYSPCIKKSNSGASSDLILFVKPGFIFSWISQKIILTFFIHSGLFKKTCSSLPSMSIFKISIVDIWNSLIMSSIEIALIVFSEGTVVSLTIKAWLPLSGLIISRKVLTFQTPLFY